MRVISIEIGVRGDVDCRFAIDECAEAWRQLLVCAIARGPEGVAANSRYGIVVEMGDARRLALVNAAKVSSTRDCLNRRTHRSVCQCCVPTGFLKSALRSVAARAGQITVVPVRHQHPPGAYSCHFTTLTGKTWDTRNLWVDFHLTIVFAKLQLRLRAQILVSEEHDAPLGDQQRQLVLLLVGQVLELQADDLCPDVRSQMNNFFGCREQSLFCWICTRPSIEVLAVIVTDVVDILQVQWLSRSVWVPSAQVNSGFLKSSTSRCWKC